jgi:hypothetical protein
MPIHLRPDEDELEQRRTVRPFTRDPWLREHLGANSEKDVSVSVSTLSAEVFYVR